MNGSIVIAKGTSYHVAVRITEGKQPYMPLQGERIIFGMKRNCDAQHLILKVMEHDADGIYICDLKPADTADLPVGEYVYDISLDPGGDDFYKVIKEAPFIIERTVTHKGDC